MNVYPEDIEAALRVQPEVRDCAVVVIDAEGSEAACAALVLQSNAASAAQAVANANRGLAEYQRLRYWLVWPHEDLPRTSTGKPRLGAIQETLQAHFGAKPTATIDSESTTNTIAESPLHEILRNMGRAVRKTGSGSPTLSVSSSLEQDLNLTSIDRVELLGEIEDRFQTDVNEAAFANARTVSDLESLLKSPPQPASPYPYVRWARNRVVAMLRELAWWTLVTPAMLLLGYPRAAGRERLRGLKSPFLLVANHQSEIDAAFLLAALPNQLRRRMTIAMGGERLRDMRQPPAASSLLTRMFDPVGYVLLTALFHVFPLPKQSGVRGSFEFVGELIDLGWSVMIFPEGQLTKDGTVGPFRKGIGVLATSLGVPVLPAKLSGLYELRKTGRRYARGGEIHVHFGKPVRFEHDVNPETAADELHRIVSEMN
jgi:long-chain acyl-CoA synthetase